MKQSSWEANRFSASQEIPHILWNLEVQYRIHKCPPPVPVSSSISVWWLHGCTVASFCLIDSAATCCNKSLCLHAAIRTSLWQYISLTGLHIIRLAWLTARPVKTLGNNLYFKEFAILCNQRSSITTIWSIFRKHHTSTTARYRKDTYYL